MLKFSDEVARKLESVYSSMDVAAQRSATVERLRLRPGEEVIDIGCGPGFLCEEIAQCVGPTGRVLGIDTSEDLLSVARGRNTRDWLKYRYGVEPDELAAWVHDLRSLSAEGRYFFNTTRCFFGVTKPVGTASQSS